MRFFFSLAQMQCNVAFLMRFIFSLAQMQCDVAFLMRFFFSLAQTQCDVAFLVRFFFSLAQMQYNVAFLVRLAFPQVQICRRSRSRSGVCPRSGFCLCFLLRPPSGTRPLPGHLLPLLHFFG